MSQAAAGFAALWADQSRLEAAEPSPALLARSDPDAWIDRLTGRHKVMIHAHQHLMTALVDARNMLANGRDHYGIPEAQHSIAIITHGRAIQGLFRDELWERFALGAYYKVNDPRTGAPATRNIYLDPQDGEPPDAVVPDLVKRGVTFVVCDVALRTLAKRLPHRDTEVEALHGQLAGGLVPGAYLVPDVFVSIERAQKRGVGYIFTDRSR